MLRTYLKLLVVLLIFSTNIFSQTHCFGEYATVSGSKEYPCFSSGNIISDLEKGMFVIRHSETLNTEDLILNKLFFKDNINLQEFVLPITDYKNGIPMN